MDDGPGWTPSLEEASSFLEQSKEWPRQKILDNSSCILECSRVVLKNGSALHEEQLACIRWLADLAESVPSFELEDDVIVPLLTSVDEYLERIYDAVQEASDVEKSALIILICTLLEKLRKVVIYLKDIKMCAIVEIPSLFNKLPVILKKTFVAQSRILDRSWLVESNSLLLSFCELAETVDVKFSIHDEFQTPTDTQNSTLPVKVTCPDGIHGGQQCRDVGGSVQVQDLCLGLVHDGVHCHDEASDGLLCLPFLDEAVQAQHLIEDDGLKVGERDVQDKTRRSDADQKAVENTKTEEEKVMDWTEKKAFEKQDKKCRDGSMKKKVLKTSRFHAKEKADVIVESKWSREGSVATGERRAKDNSRTNPGDKEETSGHVDENPDRFGGTEIEEVVVGGRNTIEEVEKADQTNTEELPSENVLDLGEAVKVQHLSEDDGLNELSQVVSDRVQVTNTCPEDVFGQSKVRSSTAVQHGEKEQVSFFQLSPAFPFIPLNSADLNSLPDQMRNSPIPDLSSSKPLPTAPGTFFILSSLTPIPVNPVTEKKKCKKRSNKTPPVKKSKKRSKAKVKASSSPTFEQKVKKSKLIAANLQKQRICNIQKFNSLISEVNGIFKCRGCHLAVGMRSKAWNHATRCGQKKKNAPKKAEVKTCKSCRKSFSSKRDLVKHFRNEHQTLKFVCTQCPTPSSFKYKFSFRRHLALKHNKVGLAPSFKCQICSYRTSQKANIQRHITRVHKSFHRVSMLVDELINSAVEESSKLCAWERVRLNNIRERQEIFATLFPEKVILKKRPGKVNKIIKPSIQMRRSDRLATSDDSRVHLVDDDTQETGEKSESGVDLTKKKGTSEIPDVDFNSASGGEDGHASADESVVQQFDCTVCSFKSKHKHSYLRHQHKKHEPLEESLPCPRSFCSLTFITRGEKEKHVKGCWLICKRHECSFKKFSRPDKYDQHLRMHRRFDEKMEE